MRPDPGWPTASGEESATDHMSDSVPSAVSVPAASQTSRHPLSVGCTQASCPECTAVLEETSLANPLRILLGHRRSKATAPEPLGAQRNQLLSPPGQSCGSTKTSVLVISLLSPPLWCGGSQSRTVIRNIDRPGPDQQRRSVLPVGAPRTGSTGHPRRARRDEAARRGAASACDPRRRTPRPINAAQ